MCRYRSILKVVTLMIILEILSPNLQPQIKGYFPNPHPDDTPAVSLVQLIAQPEKLDGKQVRFIGFLRIEFEGDAVYLHREDFDHAISRNAVWINIPGDMSKQQQSEVNMRYVICEGVFQAARHGHMGLFSGEITNVRRLELWPFERVKALPAPSR